jgi:hypothetical protein
MNEDTQIQPVLAVRPPSRNRWLIAGIITAILTGLAGIAFGVVQADSNRQLSGEISQLQATGNHARAEISQLQATGNQARAAQSAAISANLARLGICFNFQYTFDPYSGNSYVSSAEIDQAEVVNGVYVCPQGDTFVSVVPASQQSQGTNLNG